MALDTNKCQEYGAAQIGKAFSCFATEDGGMSKTTEAAARVRA
jgi:hypothetical protein